jgi:hypothetical protein
MASLLDLPDELLGLVCEYIWPDDRRARAYQLLPAVCLYATCKRFGFLADRRYLLLETRCGRLAFTSFMLDGREDGPSYWLDEDLDYCGYCEYRADVCVRKVYPAVVDEDGVAYCIDDRKFVDSKYNRGIYAVAVRDLYIRSPPLPPQLAEFFETRSKNVAGTKRVLIAHGFPRLPCAVDPALLALFDDRAAGDLTFVDGDERAAASSAT